MVKVFLDTSILLEAAKNTVDIFDELDRLLDGPWSAVCLSCVRDELESLQAKPAARLALKLVTLKKVAQLNATKPCDKALLDSAESAGGIVCTLDREMKAGAKERGLRVITLRNKKHLAEV